MRDGGRTTAFQAPAVSSCPRRRGSPPSSPSFPSIFVSPDGSTTTFDDNPSIQNSMCSVENYKIAYVSRPYRPAQKPLETHYTPHSALGLLLAGSTYYIHTYAEITEDSSCFFSLPLLLANPTCSRTKVSQPARQPVQHEFNPLRPNKRAPPPSPHPLHQSLANQPIIR